MEFKLLTKEDKKSLKQQILQMMQVSDKDFVPPLSARSSTLQKDLKSAVSCPDGIYKYYLEMEKQEILGAFDGEKLVGFVSFRLNYTNEVIPQNCQPNIYLSTLILSPETRGKGVTRNMYDHLFNELYPTYSVFTRTWSTNVAHTKILSRFGFEEFFRKPNDRGAGIDTVYFSLLRK